MAPPSRGRGGGDRQRPDGAVAPPRNAAGGGGGAGARPRLSGRLRRRRRRQGSAPRIWPEAAPLCNPPRPARGQRAGRRRGQRARWQAAGMTRWLSVIGIGEDGLPGLSPAARTLVETAETLIGGARHLAMVPPGPAERLTWRQPLGLTIADIEARRDTRLAVLASGDPLWYGVAVVLLRHFRRDEMTILPCPSAFSLAAARLGWALAECTQLSLHARPLDILRLHLAPGRRCLI